MPLKDLLGRPFQELSAILGSVVDTSLSVLSKAVELVAEHA